MKRGMRQKIGVGVSLVLFLGLSWFWRGVSVSKERDPWQRTSALFTDATGARGVHYLLKELGFGGELWRFRLDRLPPYGAEGSPSTVVLLGPSVPLTPGELRGLMEWVEDGGQVIAFDRNGVEVGSKVREESDASGNVTKRSTLFRSFGLEFSSEVPLNYSQHEVVQCRDREGEGETFSLWSGPFLRFEGEGFLGLVDEGGDGVVAVVPRGKGRLVAALDPFLLSNRSLRMGDNAVWFVKGYCEWGTGRVVLDEYHHGFGEQASMVDLSRRFFLTPWGWCALQVGLAGLLFLMWTTRRMGRLEEVPMQGARDPLRLVQARAGLFRQAEAQSMCADLICHQVMVEADRLPRPGQTWEVWWREQAKRYEGKPLGDSIRRVEGLRLRVKEEEPGGESTLVALGQEAASIQSSFKHESRYE